MTRTLLVLVLVGALLAATTIYPVAVAWVVTALIAGGVFGAVVCAAVLTALWLFDLAWETVR